MSIATKTGDKGETSLFGGKRVKKYDMQVEAYGAVDETTCFIGSAHEVISDTATQKLLTDIQKRLYEVMAYLSDAPIKSESISKHLKVVESTITDLENTLPKLTKFVFPQGSEETVRLHIARTQIRSAERRVVAFIASKENQTGEDGAIIKYLNRLSDLFFMLARKYDKNEQTLKQ